MTNNSVTNRTAEQTARIILVGLLGLFYAGMFLAAHNRSFSPSILAAICAGIFVGTFVLAGPVRALLRRIWNEGRNTTIALFCSVWIWMVTDHQSWPAGAAITIVAFMILLDFDRRAAKRKQASI